MAEDDLLSDYVGAEAAPSAEEEALEREQAQSLAEQKEMLLLAMLSLNAAGTAIFVSYLKLTLYSESMPS